MAQFAWRNCAVSIAARLALGLAALVCALPAAAGESRIGDYVIHYNALNSQNLTPAIAKQAGITRAGDNVVIIVNVQRPETGKPLNNVSATVAGSARDLLGNKQTLKFAEHRESNTIDYLAQTRIKNKQLMIFDLIVTPEDGPTQSLQFQQTLFTQP